METTSYAENEVHDEQVNSFLEKNPLLLYYTSMKLLIAVNPSFSKLVTKYWRQKLRLTDENFHELPVSERESREAVCQMITSGTETFSKENVDGVGQSLLNDSALDTKSTTPAVHDGSMSFCASSFIGCSVAVLDATHLNYLPVIIRQETHFAQEEIVIDESNFESVFLKLQKRLPRSIIFVYVCVTGRLSAEQIQQLITLPSSSMKFIFTNSSSILSVLDSTASSQVSIYVPLSIKEDRMTKLISKRYTRLSAVGLMIHYTTTMLSEDPKILVSSEKVWDDGTCQSLSSSHDNWRTELLQWAGSNPKHDSDFAKIVISSDHMSHAQLLRSEEDSLTWSVFDAGNRDRYQDLKNVLDGSTSFNEMSNDNVSRTSASLQRRVVVLINASYLPQYRLEVILSRCIQNQIKLILLMREAGNSMTRFRISLSPSKPPVWIRLPLIILRSATDRSLIDSQECLAYSGLRLLFSEKIISERQFQKVQEYVCAMWNEAAPAINFMSSLESIEILNAEDMYLIVKELVKNGDIPDLSEMMEDETKISLGRILALHVNVCLRFPKEGVEEENLISFHEFCMQPRLRLLSQVHRIEAWICYLYSRTSDEKRLSSVDCDSLPFGLPISDNFVKVPNVHSTFSPGPSMTAIMKHSGADHNTSILDAEYFDRASEETTMRRHELMERRALAGIDLDWEDMFCNWQNGPDLSEDILEHIITYSINRIFVVLSMPPKNILNLKLEKQALLVLAADFKSVEALLHEPNVDKYRCLRERVAALWWLLLTCGAVDSFHESDQKLLLDSEVCLELSESEEGSQDIFFRLAKTIIRQNAPDLLSRQHSIRSFLLGERNRSKICELLSGSDVQIGRSLIEMLVQDEFLKKLIENVEGTAITDKLHAILVWVKEPEKANREKMMLEMEWLASRMTPQAVASLVLHFWPSTSLRRDLEIFRDSIMKPYLSRLDPESAQEALDEVLQLACMTNQGRAVNLIETFADEQLYPTCLKPSLQGVHVAWREVYTAIVENSPGMLVDVQLLKGFKLPLENSHKLCTIYINHFAGRAGHEIEDLSIHSVLLPDKSSRESIFRALKGYGDRTVQERSLLSLLWFAWWSMPSAALSLRYLPTPDTWPLFKQVTNFLNPHLSDRDCTSSLARFVLKPHTLPLSTLNALKLHIIGGGETTAQHTYVLAQEGNNTWPIYAFRCHHRPLPGRCKEALISTCASNRGRYEIKVEDNGFSKFFPHTDSGVSHENIYHNLYILLHIDSSSIKTSSQCQTFLCTHVWFMSAGFNKEDMRGFFSQQSCSLYERNLQKMEKQWSNAAFAKQLVFAPLPVYTEVRYVEGSDSTPLFRNNSESFNLTNQWLSMIVLHFGLSDDAVNSILESSSDSGQGTFHTPEDVRNLMEYVSVSMVEHHEDIQFHDIESCNKVVEKMTIIADFLVQLSIGNTSSAILEAVFDGIASKLVDRRGELQVCIADALFVLVGINPQNNGIQVKYLLENWIKYKLHLGTSMLEEIGFIVDNIYQNGEYSAMEPLLSKIAAESRMDYLRGTCNEALTSFLHGRSAVSDNLYAYRSGMKFQLEESLIGRSERPRDLADEAVARDEVNGTEQRG